MKAIRYSVLMLLACLFAFSSLAVADVTYTYIDHSYYQSINSDGSSAWPSSTDPVSSSPYPITLIGVVINNPKDMLDYSVADDSPEWQTFIQALPDGNYEHNGTTYTVSGDYGGTALYMRQNTWNDGDYTDQEWLDEIDRISGTIAGAITSSTLKYGDIVVVQANAPGMFYKGKRNVNEMHYSSSAYDFSVTVIGSTTPTAANIDLSDLKASDAAGGSFNFKSDRSEGCEYYQGSLVHLEGLVLDSGSWEIDPYGGAGSIVTVGQYVEGEYYTFSLVLGLDDDLFETSLVEAIENGASFDVTAILDQEAGYSAPFNVGYRLWLTSASNLNIVPEPCTLVLLAAGLIGLLTYAWRKRK